VPHREICSPLFQSDPSYCNSFHHWMVSCKHQYELLSFLCCSDCPKYTEQCTWTFQQRITTDTTWTIIKYSYAQDFLVSRVDKQRWDKRVQRGWSYSAVPLDPNIEKGPENLSYFEDLSDSSDKEQHRVRQLKAILCPP